VRVINDDEPRFPVRPTAFTPNNDGRNDEWFVESTDVMTLLVFDRWGRLIHKDSGQTVRWNGGDYTPGTYPYILEKISCMGKVRSTHGLINLIK
jgi:gliding motility-associated-like protein